jgi:hypothetical protein
MKEMVETEAISAVPFGTRECPEQLPKGKRNLAMCSSGVLLASRREPTFVWTLKRIRGSPSPSESKEREREKAKEKESKIERKQKRNRESKQGRQGKHLLTLLALDTHKGFELAVMLKSTGQILDLVVILCRLLLRTLLQRGDSRLDLVPLLVRLQKEKQKEKKKN